jgi:GNAT superfamily N-acetyltransferase
VTRTLVDLAATAALVDRCPQADRIRRAGTVDPGLAAHWLLPQGEADVAVGAVDVAGNLVGVANANLVASTPHRYEVAVLVAPEHRRGGVATALLMAVTDGLPAGASVGGVVRADDAGGLGLLRHLAPNADVRYDSESIEFVVLGSPAGREAADVA